MTDLFENKEPSETENLGVERQVPEKMYVLLNRIREKRNSCHFKSFMERTLLEARALCIGQNSFLMLK
jgi:hypothetical protein